MFFVCFDSPPEHSDERERKYRTSNNDYNPRAFGQTLLGPLVKNRLIPFVAQDLRLLFGPGEVDRIYLNFSDPWPKNRYGKRRLTHRNFLVQYHGVLANGGSIHFKTDNRGLFEFSLNEFAELGLNMKNISLDLHANEPEDNVRTEYETKFSGLGFPIFRVEVSFPENWQWTSWKEEKQV